MRIEHNLTILIVSIGAIALQIFLSNKNNKRLGLILPLISFIFSVIAVIGVVLFYALGMTFINKFSGAPQTGDLSPIAGTVLYVFASGNILTVILGFIYFFCRNHQNKKRTLEK